jgi:hypothetical protein
MRPPRAGGEPAHKGSRRPLRFSFKLAFMSPI